MGRMKSAISEEYEELKEKAKEVGLNTNVKEQKQWYKTRQHEEVKQWQLMIMTLKLLRVSNTYEL